MCHEARRPSSTGKARRASTPAAARLRADARFARSQSFSTDLPESDPAPTSPDMVPHGCCPSTVRRVCLFWSHRRSRLQDDLPRAAVDDPARAPGHAGDRRGQGGLDARPVSRPRARQPGGARWCRRSGVRQADDAAPLRRRRLSRRRHLRDAACAARRRGAADSLSGDSAQPVRRGGRTVGAVGLRQGCAGDRGEAVRAGSGFGAGAQPRAAHGVRRSVGVSHRPLSRQGSGAEPGGVPLRQHVSGADLEPQLRRERAGHHGGEFRRAGARRFLRGDGRDSRRAAEPPVAGGGDHRDGAARGHLQRVDSRRGGQAPAPGEAARSVGAGAWPISWLPARRTGRGRRFDGGDLLPPCGWRSTPGAGTACLS